MADTYSKKELQKKRDKKKQDKLEKREERKTNNNKGKTLEEMLVYIDENGNITDVPPDQQKRSIINLEDIQMGAAPVVTQKEFTGVITSFFEDKNYGFIREDGNGNSIFVHENSMLEPLKEKDKVSFEKERTPKGYAAINVKKVQ